MKINHINVLKSIVLTLLICLAIACSSLKITRKIKMADEEYYSYLRQDTSICELPEYVVSESFLEILDTIITTKSKFSNCDREPNPYVYSIIARVENNSLIYEIEPLFSTRNLDHFYKGAFNYRGEIFVVSDILEKNEDLFFKSNTEKVTIPFCDRIHHPKFKYVSIFRNGEICIECVKNEIITIK
jgi:hypothetical protein